MVKWFIKKRLEVGKISIIFVLITSLVFGFWFYLGWPRIWQKPQIPSEIQTAQAQTPIVTILTGGATWNVPSDWNNNDNVVHVIGGGAGGASGGTGSSASGADGGRGGGGGAYARQTNIGLTPDNTIDIQIGGGGAVGNNGGETWFSSSTVLMAKGGLTGSGITGGTGGSADDSEGEVTRNGGDGGDGGVLATNAGGGGGGGGSAAGLDTAGNGGITGSAGSGNTGGAGGVGAVGGDPNGGSAGSGGAAETTGGSGGNGSAFNDGENNAGAGGSAGGGGGSNRNGSGGGNGGTSGLYGAGGAGGGGGGRGSGAAINPGSGSAGIQGVIIIIYTPSTVSITSIVPSSFDYGSLGTNATTTFKIASSTEIGIIVTNGGTVADYKIKGGNTTGGDTAWTLNTTAGKNQYVHRFEESDAATWTALTTENQTLKSAVAADGTVEFDLEINTPTISSDVGVEKSVPVTVVAVEPEN